MSQKFKAVVIDNQNENFTREIREIDTSHLKDGNVLVKVDYSSLNYKDALILNNGGKIVRKFPFVPGIDFSGSVVESEDDKFKKDDKVILTGFRVGEAFFGGFAQYAKVDSNFLIKKPNNISTRESMVMGTAGFTALLCALAINAREALLLGEKVNEVLVTGATGGVGSVAVMALTKMGYNVTAVTGKPENTELLKKLGAKNVINRSEFEGEPKLLGKAIWDGVVDTVGGNVLAHAISQTKHSGIVAACGNAGGVKLNTNVMPFILRGVKLWGIDSIQVSMKRREFVWSQVEKLIDFKILEELVQVLSLDGIINIFPEMLKGQTSGRIIVDVNK